MKDIFGLANEIAVVTGALGKLGPIWIEALLDAGASVYALDLADARIPAEFSKLQTRYDETRLRSVGSKYITIGISEYSSSTVTNPSQANMYVDVRAQSKLRCLLAI